MYKTLMNTYCLWKSQATTWDVKNLLNNGLIYHWCSPDFWTINKKYGWHLKYCWYLPGTLNIHFLMVISVGWFQIFISKMVVSPFPSIKEWLFRVPGGNGINTSNQPWPFPRPWHEEGTIHPPHRRHGDCGISGAENGPKYLGCPRWKFVNRGR